MKASILFLLLSFSLPVLSQGKAPDSSNQGITDKNITEAYGAYMLAEAYREHGNWGVKVQTKAEGKKKVFVVEPGPIYHFGDISVTGVKTIPSSEFLKDAPKVGDVYSPIRVNDWVASVMKKYPLKVVGQRFDMDHPHARVLVHITFQELNSSDSGQ